MQAAAMMHGSVVQAQWTCQSRGHLAKAGYVQHSCSWDHSSVSFTLWSQIVINTPCGHPVCGCYPSQLLQHLCALDHYSADNCCCEDRALAAYVVPCCLCQADYGCYNLQHCHAARAFSKPTPGVVICSHATCFTDNLSRLYVLSIHI